MLIFSFDCAIKNIGICCIEIKDTWREETKSLISEIYDLYDTDYDKITFLTKTVDLLTRINQLVDNQLVIKFLNVIDLIPDKKVKDIKFSSLIIKLKYILACLDHMLPKPDVVLIEHQMSINDKARGISRYIEEYYTPLRYPDDNITYAVEAFPVENIDIEPATKETVVYIVNPNLKNSISIDPSKEGAYGSFIEKYANYTANKKHTEHQLVYYLKKMGLSHYLEGVDNKLNDIADAFMMAYAWCKQHELI